MIVYFSSKYKVIKVMSDLQNKRTTNSNPANFLACPAVRDSWHNVFMFSLLDSVSVNYEVNSISSTNGVVVNHDREPHLSQTNIFRIESPTYVFAENPLKIKTTAPYFHNVSYQSKGTFIGGVFDIGRWFRPLQSEIITWEESGTINFKQGEPLFYLQFLTQEPVTLEQFNMTSTLHAISETLINSPFQVPENFQGTFDSRYKAFERSDYRTAILEEIKANLVSEYSASPSV